MTTSLEISTQMGLGARIRTARLLSGMEQADLARSVGTSRQTISNWERGIAEPSATAFVRIARSTSQPLAWFADGIETNEKTPSENDGGLDVVRPKGFEPLAFWSVVWEAPETAQELIEGWHDASLDTSIA